MRPGSGPHQPSRGGWLFARAHHVGWALAALVGGAVAVAVALSSSVAMLDRSGSVSTPLVRLIPVALGAVVGLLVGTSAPELESVAGERRRRALVLLVAAVALLGCGLLVGGYLLAAVASGTVVSPGLAVVLARSFVASSGLALCAASVLGAAASWAAPAGAVVAVTLLGYDGSSHPYVWNVVGAQPGAPATDGGALALFVLGTVAVAASRRV